MFNNLFAICLLVNDFKKSLEFYHQKLGLKINSQDKGYADFKTKGSMLAIFQKDEAVAMFPQKYMGQAGGSVIALEVESVKKSCQRLKQKGVKIFAGPKTTPWGQKVAYFKDPDGHIIELTEAYE